MKYEQIFEGYIRLVEDTLKKILPPPDRVPAALHEGMHYAVFTGGKRFRPVLTLAAAEACGGDVSRALVPAAAIELIHAYSLVHDDLPALDNDDLRRGKPTVHRQYGEALAILIGDALLTQAFQAVGSVRPAETAASILTEVSTAAGSCGMIGGQVADLQALTQEPSLPLLDHIHVHKTGKLIRCAAVCGALAAGGGEDQLRQMTVYGEMIGLAFQAVDDLQDGDGYLKIMKASEVRDNVRDLIAKAKREVKSLGSQADKLMLLADDLLSRIPKENTHHAEMDSKD